MEDDYGRRPWVYEATITDPTGLQVHVTATVPAGAEWDDAKECGEFAQMAAERAMQGARKSRKTEQERCPF
jgi:hypothetical protein